MNKSFIIFIIVFVSTIGVMSGVPGGIGEEHPVSEQEIQIAMQIKGNVEDRLGTQLKTYVPVTCATQLVNGKNYFIKVEVGDNKYIVVKAYKSFAGAVSLTDVKEGLSATSSITYF